MNMSVSIARIRGIDVRVHATFVLTLLFGALLWSRHGSDGALFGAAVMLLVFSCVLLHELGHSLVAQRVGVQVRDIVLYPLGGIATMVGQPRRMAHEVWIAAAGPAVNVALAVGFGAALYWTGDLTSATSTFPTHLPPSTATLLLTLFGANCALAAFNLLPFFPLDGGRILRALLAMRFGERRGTLWAAGVGQLGAGALLIWALTNLQLLLGALAIFLFLAAAAERRRVQLEPILRKLRAEDIAERPSVELSHTARIGEAVTSLLKSSQRVLPVVDDERVVGLVTREALLRAALDAESSLRGVQQIAAPALFVDARQSAESVLAALARTSSPAAVVMSGTYPIGLVTLSDASQRSELWATLDRLNGAEPKSGPLARPDTPV